MNRGLFALPGLVLALCALSCTDAPTADNGGGSSSEVVALAGMARFADGTPAAGARVIVHVKEYLAPVDGMPLAKSIAVHAQTVVDPDGRYFVDSLEPGLTYVVEIAGIDNASMTSVYAPEPRDTIELPVQTLAEAASIQGWVSAPSGESWVQVYGLDHAVRADSLTGAFTLSGLPAGTHVLRAVQWNGTVVLQAVALLSADAGATMSAETLSLRGANAENYADWPHWRDAILNTTPTGANITQTVAAFPVLIRLDSSNFDFGQSMPPGNGGDLRFSTIDGTPLLYEVEYFNVDAQRAAVWVLVDSVRANDSTQVVRIYWGRAGAPDWSDGGRVFDTANGFAGVWHFSGARGMRDATPNRNDALDSGSTAVAGPSGSARHFDGTQGLVVPDQPSLEPASLTLSCWVRRNGAPDSLDKIIQKGYAAPPFGSYAIEWRSRRAMVGFQISQLDTMYTCATSVLPLQDARWCFVAGTFDAATGVGRFYVDGVLAGEFTRLVPINYYAPIDYPLFIGRQTLTEAGFNGAVDEARLCAVPRSALWIKLCFENQREGTAFIQWR